MNDSQALRDFVGIDLSRESVPDATTLLMRAGTIVDATSIAAPSLTKNADDTRDPEMHQTKQAKNTAQLLSLFGLRELRSVSKMLSEEAGDLVERFFGLRHTIVELILGMRLPLKDDQIGGYACSA
jgi:hypothetical protein